MEPAAERQFTSYLESLQSQRRLSSHTLASYCHDLSALRDFCLKIGVTRWVDLDPARLREHISSRHATGMASRSLQRELSAIRGFYDFLIKRRETEANPARGLKSPKASRKLPKALDVDQMGGLLNVEAEDELKAASQHTAPWVASQIACPSAVTTQLHKRCRNLAISGYTYRSLTGTRNCL